MTIKAATHRTFKAAADHAEQNEGLVALMVGHRYLTTTEAEADRIAAAGVSFAYLFIKDGKYLTVPVN